MTGPDPSYITASDWAAAADLLAALWFLLGSALGFGASMLLAHGMIPSLAVSRDIPPHVARRIRAPLYAVAVAFLLLGLYAISLFIQRLDFISNLFYAGAQ
ncbi:MAG: hypothetical protein OXE50_11485 [Chloroflexi bacterium]|nr:hypothetical protein [Chloroflexota bacterium]